MAENERHYCMVAMPREAEGNTRAALLNEFKWSAGTTVRVRFLEGDPELQKRVQRVAEEWTGPDMANLTWQFGDDPDADVRVAFEQGNGSWSYLGTMCQQIPAPEPTMNYGWLTPDSGDDELHRVVAHEFGHALGLIHEHQNPDTPIDWNREQHVQALRPQRGVDHAHRPAVDHDVPDPGQLDQRRLLGRPQQGAVRHRPGVHPRRLPVVAGMR
jgi:hypothetical protein